MENLLIKFYELKSLKVGEERITIILHLKLFKMYQSLTQSIKLGKSVPIRSSSDINSSYDLDGILKDSSDGTSVERADLASNSWTVSLFNFSFLDSIFQVLHSTSQIGNMDTVHVD